MVPRSSLTDEQLAEIENQNSSSLHQNQAKSAPIPQQNHSKVETAQQYTTYNYYYAAQQPAANPQQNGTVVQVQEESNFGFFLAFGLGFATGNIGDNDKELELGTGPSMLMQIGANYKRVALFYDVEVEGYSENSSAIHIGLGALIYSPAKHFFFGYSVQTVMLDFDYLKDYKYYDDSYAMFEGVGFRGQFGIEGALSKKWGIGVALNWSLAPSLSNDYDLELKSVSSVGFGLKISRR